MNATDPAARRYTSVAIALHWVIATLILFNLAFGFFMEGFDPKWKGIVVALHASSGLTVLVLTVVRALWRLLHPAPPFPLGMAAWERGLAHAAHATIYFLMFAMPLTGWALISAHPIRAGTLPLLGGLLQSGANLAFWGVFKVPTIRSVALLDPQVQTAAHETLVNVHSIGGWIFVGLLALHVGAALKHQFLDRQAELARMGIGRIS